MSGLTKKTITADRTLATLLGVAEGELVSYAQLSKGLHEYIKVNNLRNLQSTQPTSSSVRPAAETQATTVLAAKPAAVLSAATKKCRYCNADIPAEAIFCDLCGVSQQ